MKIANLFIKINGARVAGLKEYDFLGALNKPFTVAR